MEELWHDYSSDLSDPGILLRIIIKMSICLVLGSIIGLNREHAGENAGWRTHILVTMATAAFVMALHESGVALAALAPLVAGMATGVGFLGAGVILRMPDSERVKGLTTAASIYLTAAVGCAIGLGRLWLPIVVSIFGWFTLAYVRRWEHHIEGAPPTREP